MKETDHPTPSSGDGGSIKMDPPPPSIKEDPEGPINSEHPDNKDLGLIINKQNGHADSIPDIKPKLEDLNTGPRSVSGPDSDAHTPLNPAGGGPPPPQDGALTPSSQPPGSNQAPSSSAANTPGPPAPLPGPGPTQPPGDSHFMQQQSQIFVFSTSLANKAAEAVQTGQCKSIIECHMDQPGTKQFLQKHPLKPGQFQRPPVTSQFGPGGANGPRGNAGKPAMIGEGGNAMNSVAQWVQQQNATMQQGPPSGPAAPGSAPPPGPGPSPSFSPNSFNMPPGNGQMPGGWQGPGGQGPPPNMGPGGPNEFSMMMEGPNGQMVDNMPPGAHANLQRIKVPNENLTPEQLQRREEQLANLQKIKQMLFPEPGMGPGGPQGPGMMGPGGPGGGPGGPGGPVPGGPGGPCNMFPPGSQGPGGMMTSQPNMMNSQPNMMGSPPGMMGNNPMGGGPGGPGFPGPGLPPNWDTMTPAQRDWFKLQQEFYHDKRRKMQHMQQMQMPGGPPPYWRRGGMPPGPMSPTSPTFNGPMGPMRGPSPDPNFMMPGPRRPGPGSMPMMGPNGPHGPGFDPGMDPGMQGPGGMFPDKMMPGPPGPGGNKMPLIQRAGNPEQFQPEIGPATPTTNTSGPTKPPPTYAQAQKRKRSGDDLDELYKKLQPAPSPQQFSYMNQFEGQELTITKQLNTAYQEPSVPSPSSHHGGMGGGGGGRPPSAQPSGPKDHAVNSPMPANTSSSIASTSVASPLPTSRPSSRPASVSGLLGPPAPSLPGPNNVPQNPQGGPGSASSNASNNAPNNHRLSHFDLMGPSASNVSTGAATTPTTSTTASKPAMSNITSSSLANLAKDVENLSNQMQQNMMQGGPFHNIQVQGQMSDGGDHSPPGSVLSGCGPQPNNSQGPPPSQPSVNNTYVNATMSIGQVNIQSVNQPQAGFNANMQVQQMNNDIMPNSMPGGPGPVPGPHGPMGHPNHPNAMSQQGMMGVNGEMPPMAGKFGPGPSPNMPTGANIGPPSGPGMSPMPGGPGYPGRHPSPSLNSPGYHPTSSSSGPPSVGPPPMANANVQIQAKAPNTIQYLPANPPSSQPGPQPPNMGPGRKDMDPMMAPRFPSPAPIEGGRMSGAKFPFGGAGDMLPMGMNGPSPGHNPHMGPGGMQQSMMGGGGSMQQSMRGGMPFNGGRMGPGMGPGGPGMGPGGPGMGPGGPGPMMHGDMMPGGQMQQHMSMPGGPGPMMGGMGPQGPGMHPGDGGPMGPMGQPNGGGYSAQFQQFQQQLYAQGRPRQMNPNGPMSGGPMGSPMGMGPGPGPGMMGPGGGPDMMGPGGMVPGPGMHNRGVPPGMMTSGPGPGPNPQGMMNSGGMGGMMPNML